MILIHAVMFQVSETLTFVSNFSFEMLESSQLLKKKLWGLKYAMSNKYVKILFRFASKRTKEGLLHNQQIYFFRATSV